VIFATEADIEHRLAETEAVIRRLERRRAGA
jgi:hypothetical protein